MQLRLPFYITLALVLLAMLTAQTVFSAMMKFTQGKSNLLATGCGITGLCTAQATDSNGRQCPGSTNVSLAWHAPEQYFVNDLAQAVNGTGTYGFIFDSSSGPLDTYNYCNMPHTNPKTYPKASSEYKLEYVEIVHRHHKRTPYADNTFPREGYSWDCSDQGLFFGGKPLNPYGLDSAATYWSVYTSPSNPFAPAGFNGTCQFPQITRGGLDDSHQHGEDLKAVYAGLLSFIPEEYDAEAVSYRVTNNVITSQVASMLITGMYAERRGKETPLRIQPNSIDSLEPKYSCDGASDLFSSYGSGSSSPAWIEHLTASAELFGRLDALSGIDPGDEGWHQSWDHYFDNLSARLCHNKTLPCNIVNTTDCVSRAEANEVFRLGEYEYSFIYRDAQPSLTASVGSYGAWVAELAQNLRRAMGQGSPSTAEASSVRYRHNVAHDGSVSRLLSILQLDRMVWPGMGAEVVFELYSKQECFYLRVLWGGQVLISSHPSFGEMNMVPVSMFLAYVDGLVGAGAGKVPTLCETDA